MDDFKEFLSKLTKLDFVTVDGNKLITKEGFQVSYVVELNNISSMIKKYPIQLVIRVTKNGKRVASWGCESNEQHSEFVLWFLTTKNNTIYKEYDLEKIEEEEAKKLFNTITT
jgi:hypothetical protein